MAESGLIAVAGATGGIGGRVARRLADRGVHQVLLARRPERAPQLPDARVAPANYDDPAALRAALAGARTLLFVSGGEAADRVRHHQNVIDAAAGAGIERVVYTSFLNAAPDATFTFARDHWATEHILRDSGLAWTALRNSIYADFMPRLAGPDRVIRGPAGDGVVAAVSRDDVADAAVAVLLGGGEHDGRTYDLTGPEALNLDQVAAELGAAAGVPVRYERETVEEAYASRSGYGAPDWEVAGWVSTYTAIAAGELATVSDAVERLTGHPATSFRAFLAANPASYAHLT